ncbi:hypothetical protein [Pararhizobium qamdonense]|nr:hypothetical protein [Pararhizobium qamdonense]
MTSIIFVIATANGAASHGITANKEGRTTKASGIDKAMMASILAIHLIK